MNTKLTSVKVVQDLYNKFKMLCIGSEMTLQKLTNRSLHLYAQDDKFKETIDNTAISGSCF
jgi:hypothetical protein